MESKEYKKKIKDLIFEENLLLPDFQRDFVWKPQDQQLQLICSLFLDIPIGSILVLDKLEDIGMRDLCFQEESIQKEPSTLLMDGQQRISTIKSVFSDLYKNQNSDWKQIYEKLHSKLKFRWFLDLSLNIKWEEDKLNQKLKLLYDFYWNHKFEDYDLEDIESIIINKKILVNSSERWHPSKDIESLENYCSEESFLPLFLVLSDSAVLKSIIEKIAYKYIQFLRDYKCKPNIQDHINDLAKKTQLNINNQQKQQDIINKIYTNVQIFFNNYIGYKEIYGVEYNKSHLNKAIVAFNTMNTGGISLGVFDIISAKYSTLKKGRLSNQILQDMETAIKSIDAPDIANLIRDKFVKEDKNLITKNFSDMYLNMLSIFLKDKANEEFKLDWLKQKSLLKISENDIKEHSITVIESLILAFQFLIKRCGIVSIKSIKYKLTIIPIAYNLYKYKNKNFLEDKIEYSYWINLFSGQYEKSQNSSSIDHLNHLIKFINNSSQNEFEKYRDNLCNKKGYSDWDGFRSFYEETSYSYSSNIGEYFLQFILASSYTNGSDIFKNCDSADKRIQIKHFENLHKDHIIPSSWIGDKKSKNSPVDSVLNKFYSPSKRNQQRLNNSITEEIEQNSMKILCVSTQFNYQKAEFNSEETIKNFLKDRFDTFKKRIEQHIQKLEKKWKN